MRRALSEAIIIKNVLFNGSFGQILKVLSKAQNSM